MRHNAWFTSEHGQYIGLLEYDLFATDPREDKDLAPELVSDMAALYDEGDVWMVRIWNATFKPHMQVATGGEYGEEFPAENLFDEPVDILGGLFGYEYARDTMLEMLEECENAEE